MAAQSSRLDSQLEDLSNNLDFVQYRTRDLLKVTAEELAHHMDEILLYPATEEPQETPREISADIAQPWRESEKLLELANRHYDSINTENSSFTRSGPDVRHGSTLATTYSTRLE